MPRARASVVGLKTDNGENWEIGQLRTDASFEKYADEMHMMTWQSATRKGITWQQRRINGRHLAHRSRVVTTHHKKLASKVTKELVTR